MIYDIKVDDPNNLFYDTKCWAIKKQHINKVSVAEMRMLRWTGAQPEFFGWGAEVILSY